MYIHFDDGEIHALNNLVEYYDNDDTPEMKMECAHEIIGVLRFKIDSEKYDEMQRRKKKAEEITEGVDAP